MPGFVELLSETERDELARLGVRRRVRAGSVLFCQGDRAGRRCCSSPVR